jgi:hypothetical protein
MSRYPQAGTANDLPGSSKSQKMPGSRGATGQSGRKRPTWALDGDATSNGRPVPPSSIGQRAQQRVAEFNASKATPIQMSKASQTTAEMRTKNIRVQPPKS